MKVVVSGHSKGIGQATYNELSNRNINVIGMSRTNGYDLEKEYDEFKNKILQEDPDVFINNAYVKDKQTKLLKDIFVEWENKKKLIINICSIASTIPRHHPDHFMPYASDKRQQRDFCFEKNFMYSKKNFLTTKCDLVNINFDYVDTDFKSKHNKKLFPNLNSKEVADIIWYVMQGHKKNICFREVSFHSTRPPEQ
jgi:NADP-dependent 3-hydroxy acid dehydrogenase YdfG